MLKAYILAFLITSLPQLPTILIGYLLKKKGQELFVFPLKKRLIQWVFFSIFAGTVFWLVSLFLKDYLWQGAISCLLVSILTSYQFFLEPTFSVLLNKRSVDNDLKHRFDALKNTDINLILIERNVINAFATGVLPYSKTILLGRPLIEQLSKEELEALLMHELGHLNRSHLFILFVTNVLGISLACLLLNHYGGLYLTNNLAFLGVCFIAALPLGVFPQLVQRYLECDADRYGANKVGVEAYSAMLNKLNELTKGGLEKFSINYPTLKQRIALVQKYCGKHGS